MRKSKKTEGNWTTVIQKRLKNEKGFTLIELMATLAILAVIVLIAVPAVGGIIEKAQAQSAEAHIAMVENAGELAKVGGLEPVYSQTHDTIPGRTIDGQPALNQKENGGRYAIYTLDELVNEGYLNMDDDANETMMEYALASMPGGVPPGEEMPEFSYVVVEEDNGTFTLQPYIIEEEEQSSPS